MKTGAEFPVRANDAEVAACRTGLVVRIGPLPQKVLGLSAARADEFIAKRIGNVRIGQFANRCLHPLPFLTRQHEVAVTGGLAPISAGPGDTRSAAAPSVDDNPTSRPAKGFPAFSILATDL